MLAERVEPDVAEHDHRIDVERRREPLPQKLLGIRLAPGEELSERPDESARGLLEPFSSRILAEGS